MSAPSPAAGLAKRVAGIVMRTCADCGRGFCLRKAADVRCARCGATRAHLGRRIAEGRSLTRRPARRAA